MATPESKTNFQTDWSDVFGNTPPVGHLLRRHFSEGWTRFHALPGSKRYAETDGERQILLSRAHTLAMSCFDQNEDIWVVMARHGEFDVESDHSISQPAMAHVFSWCDPDSLLHTSFFGVESNWQILEADRLLVKIAEGCERAVFFSVRRKTVFAPYEGGFDIVSLMPNKIGELEAEFNEWMSERDDGL